MRCPACLCRSTTSGGTPYTQPCAVTSHYLSLSRAKAGCDYDMSEDCGLTAPDSATADVLGIGTMDSIAGDLQPPTSAPAPSVDISSAPLEVQLELWFKIPDKKRAKWRLIKSTTVQQSLLVPQRVIGWYETVCGSTTAIKHLNVPLDHAGWKLIPVLCADKPDKRGNPFDLDGANGVDYWFLNSEGQVLREAVIKGRQKSHNRTNLESTMPRLVEKAVEDLRVQKITETGQEHMACLKMYLGFLCNACQRRCLSTEKLLDRECCKECPSSERKRRKTDAGAAIDSPSAAVKAYKDLLDAKSKELSIVSSNAARKSIYRGLATVNTKLSEEWVELGCDRAEIFRMITTDREVWVRRAPPKSDKEWGILVNSIALTDSSLMAVRHLLDAMRSDKFEPKGSHCALLLKAVANCSADTDAKQALADEVLNIMDSVDCNGGVYSRYFYVLSSLTLPSYALCAPVLARMEQRGIGPDISSCGHIIDVISQDPDLRADARKSTLALEEALYLVQKCSTSRQEHTEQWQNAMNRVHNMHIKVLALRNVPEPLGALKIFREAYSTQPDHSGKEFETSVAHGLGGVVLAFARQQGNQTDIAGTHAKRQMLHVIAGQAGLPFPDVVVDLHDLATNGRLCTPNPRRAKCATAIEELVGTENWRHICKA